MNRLSVRIFLAFWAVIVLSLVAVVIINSQIHRYQRGEEFERERAELIDRRLVEPAQTALTRHGRRGLERWLVNARARTRLLELHVVDRRGQELLGEPLRRRSRALVEAWRSDETVEASTSSHRWTRVLQGIDGREYLLIMARPPRPFLFRLFGPFGPLGLLLVAIVTSGLISFGLARYIAGPMGRMREAGSALGSGELDARLPQQLTRRRDEIGGLARDFNSMAERLSSMITGQRQLLRDVSHELRSPLARINVALSLAERDADPRHLARIRTESERLDALVGEILAYARLQHADVLENEAFDLVDCLADIIADARLEGRARDVDVSLQSPDGLDIRGDEHMLRRAIENVVRNAVRHSPENGRVEVRLTEGHDAISIGVADQGPGVAPEDLERIFEPFVRVSPERSESGVGGGIGLAIARAAVERHGGRIAAENDPEGGLTVKLTLPKHFVTLRQAP
ncbi:MAG: HAMP domain-containing protein [Gammaproteobacteria bacterium]|nr:HAMP domain-containing protein [Gammaproteobacteria bacterium]